MMKSDSDIDNENAEDAAVELAYKEVCTSYHRIDEFRAKLLGLLPLASAASLFWFLKDDAPMAAHAPVIGLFGALVTVGLFFYELRGVQRCIRLNQVGKELETRMRLHGQFRRWPHSVGRTINEPVAASIIYPAVAAGWVYGAIHEWTAIAVVVTAVVFVV
ncbi:MAG: hypothetical protein ACYSR6_12195 [Planctomycetota bacterium]